MEIISSSENSFENEVLKSDQLVIVDFHAEWCGPCKRQDVVLKQFALKNPNVKICKVDVDECQVLSKSLNIKNIPTLLFYKDGKVVAKKHGLTNFEALVKVVDELRNA